MPGIREEWFPTSIWYFQVPDHENLNVRLLGRIAQERAADPRGVSDRSSWQAWHSGLDLHTRPEFGPLVGHILHNAREVAEFQCLDLTRGELFLINCWAVVNPPGGSNAWHNHPLCLMSGVYYVQVPEDSGDLVFRDPREGALLMPLPVTQYTRWTFQMARYRPVVGRMVLFPNWLYHAVEPNRSSAERIAISFNIGYRERG